MKRFLALFALLLFGVSVMSVWAAPAQVHREKQSDAEIEAAIRVKLLKSKIGKDGFTVHVHNGIATWQGTTSIMQHKGAATRMAKTAGAIQVINNIKVNEAAPVGAAGNLTGEPRHVQVKPN